MPLDLRRTYFSDQELSSALLEFARKNNVQVPLTPVVRVACTWEPELSVKLTFATDAAGRTEELTFAKNEVAAALILYCHRFKEPIPHHAEKVLEPYEHGIQFLVRFPWGDEWRNAHPAYKLTFPELRKADD